MQTSIAERQQIKISIITVFKFGSIDDLYRTVESVRAQIEAPYELILVLSSYTDDVMIDVGSEIRVKMIVNKDVSLYNAMNIGLSAAEGDAVIFLNGGDVFASRSAISFIRRHFCGEIMLYRTAQVYADVAFIRPKLKDIKTLRRYPAHQGFVAPLKVAQSCHFNEKNTIGADVEWMLALLERWPSSVYCEILSELALGGVSNNPSLRVIRSYLIESRFFAAFKTSIKYLIFVTLCKNYELYYRIIYSSKYEVRHN
jgi:hypothetical protein